MYCERFYGAVISISVEYNGSNDILTNTADTCVYMSCILGLHDKLDLFIWFILNNQHSSKTITLQKRRNLNYHCYKYVEYYLHSYDIRYN